MPVGRAAAELVRVWGGFRIEQVFRAGTLDMLRSDLHLFLTLLSGGWLLPMPRALLDNSPLRELLSKNVDFAGLRRALESGRPDSVAITATSVTDGESVTFVETSQTFTPWDRASVPLLFPSVVMDGAHFSDGAMRQMTPLAPAIRLGSDRILVIGARKPGRATTAAGPPPNMAEQFGFMLDSLFMESLQADLERMRRINALLNHLRPGPAPLGLRQVESLLVLPERDPSEAAIAHRMAIPRSLRALLRVLGARDAEARRAEIGAFLDLDREYGATLD